MTHTIFCLAIKNLGKKQFFGILHETLRHPLKLSLLNGNLSGNFTLLTALKIVDAH